MCFNYFSTELNAKFHCIKGLCEKEAETGEAEMRDSKYQMICT